MGGIWEIAFCRARVPRPFCRARVPRPPGWTLSAPARAAGELTARARASAGAERNGASWLASAWRMLEDMVSQRARVIAVLEAAGHARRGITSRRTPVAVPSCVGASPRCSELAASRRTSWITRIYVPLAA